MFSKNILLAFLSLVFSLQTGNIKAQKLDTCTKGILQAKADINAGNYKIIVIGAPPRASSAASLHSFCRHSFNEVMEMKYGIKHEWRQCDVCTWIECYNGCMDSAIEARFGTDLNKRCKAKTDSMNVAEQKNALAFYGGWDASMDALLADSLNNDLQNCNRGSDTVRFGLEIDATGQAINVTTLKSFCSGFEQKLITHIKYVRWTPAVGITGKKKPCKGILIFVFNNHQLSYFDAGFY